MSKVPFTLPRKKIQEFCHRWRVVEFSLFGSTLREDFKPKSDVDVLISFAPKANIGLFEMAQMQIELEGIFNRSVDLVEKASLRNPYRRREILQSAKVIYAA